jgi:peptidoglycan/LPS O-acetylase OafA/YrhL
MVLLLHFDGHPTSWVERAIVGVTNYGSYGVELFFVLSGFRTTSATFTCGACCASSRSTTTCWRSSPSWPG